VVKIEKSCDFQQKNVKNTIFAIKMPKNWGKHIFSATNTFLRQNSLVYAQKSSLKWPILTNLPHFWSQKSKKMTFFGQKLAKTSKTQLFFKRKTLRLSRFSFNLHENW
jgi:hypothetical protein